jgi:hypothetical protein
VVLALLLHLSIAFCTDLPLFLLPIEVESPLLLATRL